MSSPEVRTAVMDAVTQAASPVPVYNLSDYVTADEILADSSEQAVIVQFVISDNELQNIAGEGNQGWREDGTVTVHIMTPMGFESDPIVTLGDSIVRSIQGKRLTSEIVVESMSPFSDFGNGATGATGGAWKGWASSMYYVKRDCW